MKTTEKLLAFGLFTGLLGVSNAQVSNAVTPEIAMAPTVLHTGIALAPGYDLNAVAFDYGAGNYKIYWINGSTGVIEDGDSNIGSDPDVAYYNSVKVVEVAFEKGGNILVDEFYLSTLVPSADYVRNATFYVAPGQDPNIDINSSGNGVLTWEKSGDIWVSTFSVAPFTLGTPVQVASGAMHPDVVLLDDNLNVALTYVDVSSGKLIVETMSHGALLGGVYSSTNFWTYPPMTSYEHPRIAGQRNALFGPLDDFAVVAQDHNGIGAEVHGVFVSGASLPTGAIVLNNGFTACPTADPMPVVAFDRFKVDVEWSQYYFPSCSPVPYFGSPKDVLLAEFDMLGNNINGPISYFEVNQIQSDFPFVSRHSLGTVYDGIYQVTNANYREGTVFNDSGTMFWKERKSTSPIFISKPDATVLETGTFSLVNSPVSEVIEVVSTDDAPASFELYDNAGRLLEIKEVAADGNKYTIDISHLSGGNYFLRCSSSADEEVLRVMQVSR